MDPRTLAKCVLIMTEERKTLRGMAAYLHARPDVLKAAGLKRVPSKSGLSRAMRRIPQRYCAGPAGQSCGPRPSRATA